MSAEKRRGTSEGVRPCAVGGDASWQDQHRSGICETGLFPASWSHGMHERFLQRENASFEETQSSSHGPPSHPKHSSCLLCVWVADWEKSGPETRLLQGRSSQAGPLSSLVLAIFCCVGHGGKTQSNTIRRHNSQKIPFCGHFAACHWHHFIIRTTLFKHGFKQSYLNTASNIECAPDVQMQSLCHYTGSGRCMVYDHRSIRRVKCHLLF